MKNLTLNIPFNKLMLEEAQELFNSVFKSVSSDLNIATNGRIYESLNDLYSPLTNAIYFVRLIKRMDEHGQWYAYGVQLEFSPSLVTVGNDLLMLNSSSLTREVAELLLAYFVKVCALPAASVLFFDLVNSELVSATISLLVRFTSHAKATSAIEQLSKRADALHNYGWQSYYETNSHVKPFNGNPSDGFWIFGDDLNLHFCAIGDIDIDSSSNLELLFNDKPLVKLSSDYLSFTKCYAKFDLVLTRKWFSGKGSYYKHMFNKDYKNIDFESKMIVKRFFASNKNFRQTVLTDDDLSIYDTYVPSLLKSYLAGENVLHWLQFACNTRVQGQYPEIRRLVLKHSHIDISVPWKLHKKVLAQDVKAFLNFVNDFDLIDQHRKFVFSKQSAAKFLPELKSLVK